MKSLQKASILLAWVLSTGLACSEAQVDRLTGQEASGQIYLADLAAQVRRADRVVVTEHSYESDAFDRTTGKSLAPEDIVYATRVLDDAQQMAFAEVVAGLDPAPPKALAACFEPHHAVRFYERDALVGTLEVCFECGGVEWDGSSGQHPAALYGALWRLVESMGMTPRRNWRELVQEHARSQAQMVR